VYAVRGQGEPHHEAQDEKTGIHEIELLLQFPPADPLLWRADLHRVRTVAWRVLNKN
jgi:hypothetical protein